MVRLAVTYISIWLTKKLILALKFDHPRTQYNLAVGGTTIRNKGLYFGLIGGYYPDVFVDVIIFYMSIHIKTLFKKQSNIYQLKSTVS